MLKLIEKNDDVLILLDNIVYAIMPDVSIDDINLEYVRRWVDETSHDGDYKSFAYIPPYIRDAVFLLP